MTKHSYDKEFKEQAVQYYLDNKDPIIRGRLSLFQYPQGINLHKIFYTPNVLRESVHFR